MKNYPVFSLCAPTNDTLFVARTSLCQKSISAEKNTLHIIWGRTIIPWCKNTGGKTTLGLHDSTGGGGRTGHVQ